jgi:glucose/arabinose dehydrogenase
MRANRVGSFLVVALGLAPGLAGSPALAEEAGLEFRDAWPGVTFDKPVCVAAAPDASDRLFVAQRGGQVLVLKKFRGAGAVAPPRVFADVSGSIPQALVEDSQTGLATIACHPDFGTNGRLFLFYGTANADGSSPRAEIVEVRAQGDVADPASRRLLLRVPVPDRNHYGGGLAFGPDRMLYVGIGTDPKEAAPSAVGQDLRQFQGKILRISPDPVGQAGYGVPSDNPFVGVAGGARPEIWAYGLRNPFRISFDAAGTLWAGDPGSKGTNAREEINVVPKGGNLGWPAMEGTLPGRAVPGANMTAMVPPVYEYGRDFGKCSVGGIAYRGQRCPQLAGLFVFSDYMSGKIVTLRVAGGRASDPRVLSETPNSASINEDAQGELYFCQLDDNRILTLVPKG